LFPLRELADQYGIGNAWWKTKLILLCRRYWRDGKSQVSNTYCDSRTFFWYADMIFSIFRCRFLLQKSIMWHLITLGRNILAQI